MYWTEKYSDEFDSIFKYIMTIALIAVGIWCLNGGNNDWGLIHHIVIYMMLTCMACILLTGVSIALMAVRDLFIWLLK